MRDESVSRVARQIGNAWDVIAKEKNPYFAAITQPKFLVDHFSDKLAVKEEG